MFRIVSIILLIINGLPATLAGLLFIIDPSGSRLRIPLEWLETSPFTDYLIPGLILLIVIGIGSLKVAWFAWRRIRGYPVLIAIEGSALVIWIVTEMLILAHTNILQYIFGGIGLALVGLGIAEWRRLRKISFIG